MKPETKDRLLKTLERLEVHGPLPEVRAVLERQSMQQLKSDLTERYGDRLAQHEGGDLYYELWPFPGDGWPWGGCLTTTESVPTEKVQP